MHKRALLTIAVVTVIFLPLNLWAGGAAIVEIVNPAVGRAGAGWAASANDASTAFTNPAGMAKLERSELLVGVQPMYLKSNFSPNSLTGVDGGGGSNAGGFIPAAGTYYVHNLSQEWKLGVAMASMVGLGVDYDDNWAGRYYADEVEVLTLSLLGSASYQPNDWFSVGFGLGPSYGKIKQSAAINNIFEQLPDGKLNVEDDAVSVVAYAGVLFEPRQGTRVGLTYYAPTDFDFKDTVQIAGAGPLLSAALQRSGLAGSKVDMDLTIPQIVMLSMHQDISEDKSLMVNVGWQDWSEFGMVDVGISGNNPQSLSVDKGYKDTWHFAFGGEYRFVPKWRGSLGLAYDSSAVSNEYRTPAFAVDRQIRYAGGVQYDYSEDLTLGAAYSLVDLGDASIDQERGPLAGRLAGSYSANWLHIVALNATFKF